MHVKQNVLLVWSQRHAGAVINAREEKREEIFIAVRTATEHGNQLLRGRECYSRGVLLAQGVRCSSFRAPVSDREYRRC